MNRVHMDPGQVTKLLADEGLRDVKYQDEIWLMTYATEGAPRRVMLILPEGGEYFIAMAIAVRLDDEGLIPFNEFDAPLLRKLFRLQSGNRLARLDVLDVEDTTSVLAVSDCSVDGVTGKKLARRLEACVRLATKAETLIRETLRPSVG